MTSTTLQYLGFRAGLIIPVWLGLGVFIAGKLYPGYDHFNQAMSELGAVESPTHLISPLMNNYPLGFLFILFGLAVFRTFPSSLLSKFSGAMIVLHGITSITAGAFSCDVGCNLDSTLMSQTLHNLSGLVMFLSVVVASSLWAYLAPRLVGASRFGWFSLVCTLVAITALPLMGAAIESGVGFGLYQRINYGASVIWVAGFAYVLLDRDRKLAFVSEG